MNDENTDPKSADPLHGNRASDLFRAAIADNAPAPATGPWSLPDAQHLSGLLPGFEIRRLLGRGGMGAVYEAVQISLHRQVAIKLLPPELAASPEFIDRFRREAQTLARLHHPGIVAVHDSGQTAQGHLYFVMEYVDGTDLHRLIHGGGLNPRQALDLTIQICGALHYAHRCGVVHRDVKPANVLITREGVAKLADFGLARPLPSGGSGMTAASLVMGTPDYMAPEQWSGLGDHRADIYALGVMLYEMLTGARPQGAFDLPSQRAQVDSRLDEVVLKAMRQEPDRRYQQVTELREDVERIRTTGANPAQPPSAQAPQAPRRRRSAKATGIWAGAAVLLLGIPLLLKLPRSEPSLEGTVAVLPRAAGQASGAEPEQWTSVQREQVSGPAVEPVPDSGAPFRAESTRAPALVEDAPQSPILPPAGPHMPAAPAAGATSPHLEIATVPAPPVVAESRDQAPPRVLHIVSAQAQNLIAWTLAPLDEELPSDIRQRIAFAREDLVDEGKGRPKSSLDAYRAAYFLCEELLSALAERDQARTAAGVRAAQVAADQPTGSQALNARRNFMANWTQYERENAQRMALTRQSQARTALAGEAQKAAWAARAEKLRAPLDHRYRTLRAAMR